MSYVFIDSQAFPSVRVKIDASIDEVLLPDEVIDSAIFAGEANATILDRVPDYASRNAADMVRLKNACAIMTAGLIAPSMPDIISEKHGQGQEYQRKPVDYDKRGDDLIAEANQLINKVLSGVKPDANILSFFGVAEGNRGQ